MANFDLMRELAKNEGGKIVLLVLDGLGGLPMGEHTQTTLEYADTPNMDRLAVEGCQGLSHPILRGITPGSGPAHLALFGYDPVANPVGRGVLSALGIGFDLRDEDVAARGNFCTVDENGLITDRRAGRISTEKAMPLVEKLNKIQIDGAEVFVHSEKEYRFVLVLRGEGLSGAISDTDPQSTGERHLPIEALNPSAERTADLLRAWSAKAQEALKDDYPANSFILRGFAQDPKLPKFAELYKLKAACVAVYPMYKGVSKLVGMTVLKTGGDYTPADEFQVVADHWNEFDFFFVHVKPTDSRGEDGNFEAKAAVIEQVDKALPKLLELNPDVLVITGDHSTPAALKSHSWHPVPTLLWAPGTHLQDMTDQFGERQAQRGGLGQFPASDLMSLAMAHALRLEKYGA